MDSEGKTMSMFKVGDRVVWMEKPDQKWNVHYLWNSEYIQIIRKERGGFASIRVPISEIRHVDRYAMIRAAVREVLLSEEFLLAFGKAITNAPIPSSIQCGEAGKEFPKPSIDSIPDGWRELEPKEIPKKGGRFWYDGEWVELLVDGTVEYEYFGEKHICKIEPPKPAFAIGDRVRVCNKADRENGQCGVVTELDSNLIKVAIDNRACWFEASELEPVEASK